MAIRFESSLIILAVHKSEKDQDYLNAVPGCLEFVFIPRYASWLNLVEGFFSKMTKQMLRDIRLKTKQEQIDRIYKYFHLYV